MAAALEIKSHDVVHLQSHGGKSRPSPESRRGEHGDLRSWHKDTAGLVGKWGENCCSIQKQPFVLAIMALAGPLRPKVPPALQRQARDRQERRRKWNSRSRSDVMMMSRLCGKAGPGQTWPISYSGGWGSGASYSPISPLLPSSPTFAVLIDARASWRKGTLSLFLSWSIFLRLERAPYSSDSPNHTRDLIPASDGEHRPGRLGAWLPHSGFSRSVRSPAPDEQLNGAAHSCMFCIPFHVPSCRYHAWAQAREWKPLHWLKHPPPDHLISALSPL